MDPKELREKARRAVTQTVDAMGGVVPPPDGERDGEMEEIIEELSTAVAKLALRLSERTLGLRRELPPPEAEELSQQEADPAAPEDDEPPYLTLEDVQFLLDHYDELPKVDPRTGKPFGLLE